jgi:hypothetical protein
MGVVGSQWDSGRGIPSEARRRLRSLRRRVAARYGRQGASWARRPGLTRDPLSAVEIWTEPYGSRSWKPRPDPAGYAALERVTAPAVHAVDPQMRVLMSGDLKTYDRAVGAQEGPWIERLPSVDPGAAKLVNGLDVHPYPTPPDDGPFGTRARAGESFARIPLIRQIELKAGVTLPIWITEVGWTTSLTRPVPFPNRPTCTCAQPCNERSPSGARTYRRSSGSAGIARNDPSRLRPTEGVEQTFVADPDARRLRGRT